MRKLLAAAAVVAVIVAAVFAFYLMHPERPAEEMRIHSWLYHLQNASPSEISRTGFQLVVMDYSRDGTEKGEYAREEIERMKQSGKIPVAYLSIGEAEDYRFYWNSSWNSSPPDWLGKENPEWKGNYAVRYWEEEWKSILKEYIDRIVGEGFQGIYLDKVDEYEYWSSENNGEGFNLSEREAAERMAHLIKDLANYTREEAGEDFLVIPQNGEGILEYDSSLLSIISGWGAENLFYNGTSPWSAEDMRWIEEHRLRYLDMVVSRGKFVLSVDYVDDGSGYSGENRDRIEDYRAKALKHGFVPYVARDDRMLDEINTIPGVQG